MLDTAKEKDQRTLQELAKKVKLEGLCDGMDAMEVYTRLDRLRKIREKDIVAVTIDHELEDVVEIFSRLDWFLQASRFGRYSGSGTTSLEEDLRDVAEGTSFTDAVQRLLKRFLHKEPLTSEDFMRDYADSRFGRFFLYLMVYRNKAQDWDEHGHRLGFEGITVLADFRPQWHHIFPRKYLEGKADDVLIDPLANIAVIGPEINIRISAKDPMSYIDKYGITSEKLAQRFVDSQITTVAITQYETWLRGRAQRLSEEGNAFLRELRGPLV